MSVPAKASAVESRQHTLQKIAETAFEVMPFIRCQLLGVDMAAVRDGMPISHVQILALLRQTGSLTISEISRRFGIAKPNITPIVDHLIVEGLVERGRDAHDRRVVNIILSEAGRTRMQTIHDAQVRHMAETSVGRLTDEQLAQLLSSLRQVGSFLEDR